MASKKILLIEDEETTRATLYKKLTNSGFEVKAAKNAQEGLKLLQSEIFDLLLLDLVMPHRDGFDVLQEIRSKNIAVKTVILTNSVKSENENKTRLFGAIDYWVKTDCSLVEIVDRIRRIVGR